jgi:hypothetical protein
MGNEERDCRRTRAVECGDGESGLGDFGVKHGAGWDARVERRERESTGGVSCVTRIQGKDRICRRKNEMKRIENNYVGVFGQDGRIRSRSRDLSVESGRWSGLSTLWLRSLAEKEVGRTS